ncbi:MAG TPA: DMT family transporter [Bacteroidetes bacterium]|nr:DMT family transporter [Bacteroidota bacterium]
MRSSGENRNRRSRFVLLSLLAGLFWGASFPTVKMGLAYISPVWFSQMRLALAACCLFLVFRRWKLFVKFPPEYWLLGFFNGMGFLLQFLGMQYTSATKTAFYINSNLVFVALLSFLFFKEKFGKFKITGLILALLGIYFLSVGLQPVRVLFSGKLNGDLLVLLAGVSWGIFMVLNKKMVHHPEYSVLENVTLFLFTSAVILLPVAVIFEPFPAHIVWQGWALLFFTGFIAMAIPFYLWSAGLKGLTATVSAMLVLIEILVALLLSFLFLGESLKAIEVIGAVILICAMIIANLDKPVPVADNQSNRTK